MTNIYTLKNISSMEKHKKARKYIAYPVEFIEEIDRIHFIIKKSPANHQLPFFNLIPSPFSAGDEIAFRYWAFEELLVLVKDLIAQFVPADLKTHYSNQLPQSVIRHLEPLVDLSDLNH